MPTGMREKAKRIVTRRGLGALANNTKWSEFFDEVTQLDMPFEFKLIDDEEPVVCNWILCPVPLYIEGSGIGPYPFYWVEWLRVADTNLIPSVAARVGLECVIEEARATVYGYR